MPHKFLTGQTVEYKPVGGNVGLYKIVRQMPEGPRADDISYRIKSEGEGYERNVSEYDLSPVAKEEGTEVARNISRLRKVFSERK